MRQYPYLIMLKELNQLFIHCTQKGEKILRESGLFNDLRNPVAFEKDIQAGKDWLHWHLNVVEIENDQYIILSHDRSGVSAVIYCKAKETVNSLDSYIPLVIENLFITAGCSESFVQYYLDQTSDLIFSPSGERKYLSRNLSASRFLKDNSEKIDLSRILQSEVTTLFNHRPRKSFNYKSANDLLRTVTCDNSV